MKLYCKCGAAWTGTLGSKRLDAHLEAEFYKIHSGDGHEPCDAKTAARARGKQDGGDHGE